MAYVATYTLPKMPNLNQFVSDSTNTDYNNINANNTSRTLNFNNNDFTTPLSQSVDLNLNSSLSTRNNSILPSYLSNQTNTGYLSHLQSNSSNVSIPMPISIPIPIPIQPSTNQHQTSPSHSLASYSSNLNTGLYQNQNHTHHHHHHHHHHNHPSSSTLLQSSLTTAQRSQSETSTNSSINNYSLDQYNQNSLPSLNLVLNRIQTSQQLPLHHTPLSKNFGSNLSSTSTSPVSTSTHLLDNNNLSMSIMNMNGNNTNSNNARAPGLIRNTSHGTNTTPLVSSFKSNSSSPILSLSSSTSSNYKNIPHYQLPSISHNLIKGGNVNDPSLNTLVKQEFTTGIINNNPVFNSFNPLTPHSDSFSENNVATISSSLPRNHQILLDNTSSNDNVTSIISDAGSENNDALSGREDEMSCNENNDTSNRKYKCKVCHKGFTTSGHLARHHRIHTGVKNHICPFEGCNSRFSRQDNCMQHYKTHLKSKKSRKEFRL